MSKFTLRKWQKYAIKASDKKTKGIFLEALGGRGKTICALEIAKHKKAKSILIINNKLSILKGWEDSLKHYNFNKVICITDKTLSNRIKKGEYFDVDIFIIDEWQNMCSDNNLNTYKKVKRKYTIGLSATPIRRKGTNFFGLEQTVFGEAYPNNNWMWQIKWGEMAPDRWTNRGVKWVDFRDYDNYIEQLPNFVHWELIENLESIVENNGYKLEFQKIKLPVANKDLLKDFRKYNVVRINGKTAMSKATFGRNSFVRYLSQGKVEVDFPKLKIINEDTPVLDFIEHIINKSTVGTLIVTKSVQIAKVIKERHQEISFWTGEFKEITDSNVMVATQHVMGVGVDGLQNDFQVLVVLDPVQEDSGEYDDYRQLLWRITGSRQQHDCLIIEIYFDENI